jgi:malonyl-CoA O-methyltransferase
MDSRKTSFRENMVSFSIADETGEDKILTAHEGYRRWAPSYSEETAISYLENGLVDAMTPSLAGLSLLDAGCGTGRRLAECGAAFAMGVDASAAMLEAGIGRGTVRAGIRTIVGDVRKLPLRNATFEIAWCRLVIGHLPDCTPAYQELARVSRTGALVIVTDFHPEAHEAGHRRTFRESDTVREIEHYVHSIDVQVTAARAAGLTLVAEREAAIDDSVLPFYARAGRPALFEAHRGLPVVLALAFRRDG